MILDFEFFRIVTASQKKSVCEMVESNLKFRI